MKIMLEFDSHADLVAYCKQVLQEEQEKEQQEKNNILTQKIEALGLSTMTINALHGGGIFTIGELVKKNKAELRALYSLGKVGLHSINEKLKSLGFSLSA